MERYCAALHCIYKYMYHLHLHFLLARGTWGCTHATHYYTAIRIARHRFRYLCIQNMNIIDFGWFYHLLERLYFNISPSAESRDERLRERHGKRVLLPREIASHYIDTCPSASASRECICLSLSPALSCTYRISNNIAYLSASHNYNGDGLLGDVLHF